jgi:ATP-dependent DNA helicase RecG
MTNTELIDLLAELISYPAETEWIEFKTKKHGVSDEQIGEYISAMSNGATIKNKSFGYVVFGVEDKTHNLVGTDFTFVHAKHGGNEDLMLFLTRNLQPRVNFEHFEFDYQNKHFVLIRIPAAQGEPLNFQKKPYIRIGSNKTDLRNFPEFMRTIYNSREDWSAKIVPNATFADLDPEAIAVARTKYKQLNTKKPFYDEIDSWSNLQFLDRAKVTIDGKITRTAILLLGKEQSTHYLLPSVAEMTWKLDMSRQDINKLLWNMLPAWMDDTQKNNKIKNLISELRVLNKIRNIGTKKEPVWILEKGS